MRAFLFPFLTIVALASGLAQQAVAPADASRTVAVVALDKRGNAVTDLKAEDMSLQVGKSLASITLADRQGAPLLVTLLVDASNSMTPAAADIKTAGDLADAVLKDPHAQVILGVFSNEVGLSEPTRDLAKLHHTLNSVMTRGGSSLYDSLLTAGDRMAALPLPVGARRAIVVITDGQDNQSRNTREHVAESLAARGIPVFAIYIAQSLFAVPPGQPELLHICEGTGGVQWIAQGPKPFSDALQSASQAIAGEYLLSYSAKDAPAKGNLEIRCARKDVKLHYARSVAAAR